MPTNKPTIIYTITDEAQRWQRIHYCRLFNHLLLHQALT